MKKRLLEDPQDVVRLIEILRHSTTVSRFNSTTEEQAATLAHAFSDLEKSFRTVTDDLLSKLFRAANPGELDDVLHDIGEELRHILYHIDDCKFYDYIRRDVE